MKKIFIFIFLCISLFAEKKILIITSYHNEYMWQTDYLKEIKKNLKNYDLSIFEMNTKRIEPTKFQEMANKAIEKYKKIKPDLVILGDDNALKYTCNYFSTENVPVVFLGINGNLRDYFKQRPKNFTGVLERPIYKKNIQFIKDCMPGTKNVLLLYDDSDLTKTIIDEYFYKKNTDTILGVKTDIFTTNSFQEWKEIVLNTAEKYDAVILGVYSTLKDKNGVAVTEAEVDEWTSKNSKKPVFSTWSFSVGKDKTIGGLVLSASDQGIEASKIVKKILEDRVSPISIYPVTATKGEYTICKSQMNKWKLYIPEKYKNQIKYVE